jgi:hypothetical protein
MSEDNAASAHSALVREDYRGACGQVDKERHQQQRPTDANQDNQSTQAFGCYKAN